MFIKVSKHLIVNTDNITVVHIDENQRCTVWFNFADAEGRQVSQYLSPEASKILLELLPIVQH